MKSNIKKDFFWNTLGVTLNAFTSLFYLIFVTRINGSKLAGIFTFAFSTALIIQVVGYYAGRVFQVTDNNEKVSDSDYIHSHVITSIAMVILGLMFCFIKGYTFYKILIIMELIIFRAIESFSDSIYAVIQKNNSLYQVGISFSIKSTLSVLLFLIVDIITKNVALSIIMIILSQSLILYFYDRKNSKKYLNKLDKFNKESVIYIFKIGFYTFLFTLLTQYVINAPKYAIDNYLTDTDQTIYGIISMPATAMIILCQFLIHPYLLELKAYFKRKDFKKFNNSILKLMSVLVIFGIIGLIGAYFVGIPLLKFIYNVELIDYKNHLFMIIIGSIFLSIVMLLSNALIVLRKTKGQTVIYIIDSITALIISKILVLNNALLGASKAYLYTMIILFILYIIYYLFNYKKLSKY